MISSGKFEAGEDSDGDSVYRRKVKKETRSITLEDKDEVARNSNKDDATEGVEDKMTDFFESASFEQVSKAPLANSGGQGTGKKKIENPKASSKKTDAKELAELLPSSTDVAAAKLMEAKNHSAKTGKILGEQATKARDAWNQVRDMKKAKTIAKDLKQNVQDAEALRRVILKEVGSKKFDIGKAKQLSFDAAKLKADIKENIKISRSYKSSAE